jgi:elongation of very long chain fatty acids protein 4
MAPFSFPGMKFHDQPWITAMLSPQVVFGVPFLYVTFILGLAKFMANRKALELKGIMNVYNVVQIVVCTYMTLGMLPVVQGWRNPFGIDTEYTAAGEWYVFVHYLSKYLDWFDTLFIVLKKKRAQLSFLHMYHHATIGPIWGWLCLLGIANGTIRYGAMINSWTHVLMYSHYLMTSLGFRNPLKAWLTRWQIAQFYSCFVHSVVVLASGWETKMAPSVAWMQFAYQSTMIYLFTFKMSFVPGYIPLPEEPKVNKKQKPSDSSKNGKEEKGKENSSPVKASIKKEE